jgi:hypothetical protein
LRKPCRSKTSTPQTQKPSAILFGFQFEVLEIAAIFLAERCTCLDIVGAMEGVTMVCESTLGHPGVPVERIAKAASYAPGTDVKDQDGLVQRESRWLHLTSELVRIIRTDSTLLHVSSEERGQKLGIWKTVR